jgi:hypothetical protein
MKKNAEMLEDALFGRLQWDEEEKWWKGSVAADCNEFFELFIQPCSDVNRNISDEARCSFEQLLSNFGTIRQRTLEEFLNQTHSQPFYRDITLEQLLSHIRPDEIIIRSNGYVEVGFADREQCVIGGGHTIVSRSWPNGLREVVLDG